MLDQLRILDSKAISQTLDTHFSSLLNNIEPAPSRIEIANRAVRTICTHLQKESTLETIYPHYCLIGSYARQTTIKNIKDVDILLPIDPTYKKWDSGEVLEEVFSVLGKLRSPLKEQGEVLLLKHQRRSINAHFKFSQFDLDIVPAIAENGLSHPLIICQFHKGWGWWMNSHPLGYARLLNDCNLSHHRKVLPLIKLLKHWRDIQMCYQRPKGYWLECMVYQRVMSGAIRVDGCSYQDAFWQLLTSLYTDFAPFLKHKTAVPSIEDPMFGHNVALGWQRTSFETFMRRIEQSIKGIQKAATYDRNNERKAIHLWQQIFGQDWFPLEVEPYAPDTPISEMCLQVS